MKVQTKEKVREKKTKERNSANTHAHGRRRCTYILNVEDAFYDRGTVARFGRRCCERQGSLTLVIVINCHFFLVFFIGLPPVHESVDRMALPD